MDPDVQAASELNQIFDRLEVRCKVFVTAAEGKHVRATEDMEEGFSLIEELPIVSWPSPSLLALNIPFCWQCLRLSSHHQPPSVSGAKAPFVTSCTSLQSGTGVAELPESWSRCSDCGSCFCSLGCRQGSERAHRVLCSCLPELRASPGCDGRFDDEGAGTVTPSQSLSSATSSGTPSSTSSGITLEALARCVTWVIHRLCSVIEHQSLTHEVLQADYVLQQHQQQRCDDSAGGAAWSTTSLNYQLFTQVVKPLSRLISPPDSATFEHVPLDSWMYKLRVLLADSCVKQLLAASSATLSSVSQYALSFGEEEQKRGALVPGLLWAEALVLVLLGSDTLRTLVGQMALNAHAANDYVLLSHRPASTGVFDWVMKGAGLYSLLSCFNHSCVPNASVSNVDGTHGIVLKATRPIQAGEQITITYIPLTSEVSSRAERHRQLRNYFFTCRCPRCAMEETETASSASTRGVDFS